MRLRPKKRRGGDDGLPSGKLTWQWKMDLLKMYSLLKMVIFHCHVSLLEGNLFSRFNEKKIRYILDLPPTRQQSPPGLFISLRLMPPAFAGLEIASSMARSTTKSSSNNSTILSIASSMARSTTKSNSNSSNNQQQQ